MGVEGGEFREFCYRLNKTPSISIYIFMWLPVRVEEIKLMLNPVSFQNKYILIHLNTHILSTL